MTDPTCATPSCLTDRQVKEAVLSTKMNGIILLSTLAVGLLSYSVFWQAPTLRAEHTREINQLRSEQTRETGRLDASDRDIKADFERLSLRVSALESKE